MIKRLKLKNFQIHRDSVVEFGPGINIIVGESDNGKSSIIRALRWAITNKPSSKELKSVDAEESDPLKSIVVLDNGVVTRERSQHNMYTVKIDSNRKQYKAIRKDVPAPVSKLVNMDGRNIVSQHDPITFFGDGGGQAARMINELSGVGIIDDILKETNRRVSSVKADIKATTNLLESVEAKITTTSVFVGLRKSIKKVEQLEEKIADYEKDAMLLENSLSIIDDAECELTTLAPTAQCAKKLSRAKICLEKLRETNHLIEKIEDILCTVEKEPISKKQMSDMNKIFLSAKNDLERLVQIERLLEVEEQLNALEKLNETLLLVKKARKDSESELKELKKEIGACPLCGKVF